MFYSHEELRGKLVEVNFFFCLILTNFKGSEGKAENSLHLFSLLKSCFCGAKTIYLDLSLI